MKISYNWLKEYIKTDKTPAETAELLTNCGLEVEGIENFESVKGGLKGVVVGEVISKEKHPGADRLNLTKVNIGKEELLSIVCGASNVEAGQKVVVATVGSILYPAAGEALEIKKSKIRGELSEGMICAEDEIGLGSSHDGIMVLKETAKVGMPAGEYFNLETDSVFEIGLTPNRADAMSHIGVARDLAAVLNIISDEKTSLQLPGVGEFRTGNEETIEVKVEDQDSCIRYSGILINGIKVGDSPDWLQKRLKSIGLRPINNIVDVTNFVMHELGQPLHAFDAAKIKGKKVVVKKLSGKTKFITLDETERELSSEDLMICDSEGPMCIAGVFGGIHSGVSDQTTSIFLESACFHPVSIRKTSKRHGLKTDASFRFERGTDPNITVYALKRAALLIRETSGGNVSSGIIDIYPEPVENFKVGFSYKNCDSLAGVKINRELIKTILRSLGMEIITEGADALLLSVPPFKPDVKREVDIVEEVLRIYGFNNIEIPDALRSSIFYSSKPDKEKLQNIASDFLSNNGFYETMSTSLTKESYTADSGIFKHPVKILNPLSADLNVLRQTLLYSGLESIAYNQNRKNPDLKLFEFGKTYHHYSDYSESTRLALFISGKKNPEGWNTGNDTADFYYLKGYVSALLNRLGIFTFNLIETNSELFSESLTYRIRKTDLVSFGKVERSILKEFDIAQEVFFADFNWDAIIENAYGNSDLKYKETSKFPAVRRDLALLMDKKIKFSEIEALAMQTEKTLVKKINLFDVYEGDKLEKGKKSYAVSFILQDENATLTDKQVDKVMEKLIKTFEEKVGARLR